MDFINIHRQIISKVGIDVSFIVCQYYFPEMSLEDSNEFIKKGELEREHKKIWPLNLDNDEDPFQAMTCLFKYFTKFYRRGYLRITFNYWEGLITTENDVVTRNYEFNEDEIISTYFEIEFTIDRESHVVYKLIPTSKLKTLWNTNKELCISSLKKMIDETGLIMNRGPRSKVFYAKAIRKWKEKIDQILLI